MADDTIGASASGHVVIRTSEEGWFSRLAAAWAQRRAIVLVDDARTGFDPSKARSLWHAGVAVNDWPGLLLSIAVVALGAWLLLATAVARPHGPAKMMLLVFAGLACIATGILALVTCIRSQAQPQIVYDGEAYRISW